MIWSTYSVFGSGSAGVVTFADETLTICEYLEAIKTLAALKRDDGDNGFVGTYSVPDDAAAALGIERHMWADPGPDVPKSAAAPGRVLVPYRPSTLREFFLAKHPQLASATLAQLASVAAGGLSAAEAAEQLASALALASACSAG